MQDESVRIRFSAAAASYDQHALIQHQVAEDLVGVLRDLPPVDRVLEFGCGTGSLTQKTRALLPDAKITAVDLSETMLEQAKLKISDNQNIDWIAADVCDFQTKHPYPLVISSSALHWVFPIGRALSAIDLATAPGGTIVIAIMLRQTLGELYESRQRIAPHKLPLLRLPLLSDLTDAADRLSWRIQRHVQRDFTVRYDSAFQMLRALHDQGLTGGAVSRSHAPLTRGELIALVQDYDSRHQDETGSVAARYQVGFLHCQKA